MFSLPSWFGLRKLYFSRNLFVFSRSLILLCIIACHNLYDPSYFCSVTCNFSFIFYFIYLGLLFFFSYLVWIEFYKFCLTFQNQLLASLIFWNYFCLYFIYFCSDLYYFFPYTNFGLCSFFLVPFGVRQIWDFFFFFYFLSKATQPCLMGCLLAWWWGGPDTQVAGWRSGVPGANVSQLVCRYALV